MHQKSFALVAALVNAIHVVRSRQDVAHVKTELLKRLRKASDWLASAFLACDMSANCQQEEQLLDSPNPSLTFSYRQCFTA